MKWKRKYFKLENILKMVIETAILNRIKHRAIMVNIQNHLQRIRVNYVKLQT